MQALKRTPLIKFLGKRSQSVQAVQPEKVGSIQVKTQVESVNLSQKMRIKITEEEIRDTLIGAIEPQIHFSQIKLKK